MRGKPLGYWDDWNDFKNESDIEEELDEQGVDFDQRFEGNELELY